MTNERLVAWSRTKKLNRVWPSRVTAAPPLALMETEQPQASTGSKAVTLITSPRTLLANVMLFSLPAAERLVMVARACLRVPGCWSESAVELITNKLAEANSAAGLPQPSNKQRKRSEGKKRSGFLALLAMLIDNIMPLQKIVWYLGRSFH